MRTTPSEMLAIRAPAPSPSAPKRMTSCIPRQSFMERRARKLPGPPLHPKASLCRPGGLQPAGGDLPDASPGVVVELGLVAAGRGLSWRRLPTGDLRRTEHGRTAECLEPGGD